MDTTHLLALNVRLSHEFSKRSAATSESEKKLRTVWIKQIEKEIKDERKLLGLKEETDLSELSDDELIDYLIN